MYYCPKCKKPQDDEQELYLHLRTEHKLSPEAIKGSGWFERKEATPDGDVAPEHRAAALRAQMQKNRPLDVPMVTEPPPKQEIKLSKGWVKITDGYEYERVIEEKQTSENFITKVLKGKITANHAVASLFTYTKDTTALSAAREKEGILEGRLVGYTVSDPEYLSITGALHNLKHKINELKKNSKSDVDSALIHESYFDGELINDKHEEWQGEQMKKISEEADRLSKKPPTGDETTNERK